MRKNWWKSILSIICFGIMFLFGFVFAGSEDEAVIKSISNSILNALSWFAYIIALGVLIFFGIKYLLAGANEKANLKGMLPKYLIGIALIVLCFTIAKAVANIAGNDQAEDIIAVGENVGINFVDTVVPPASEDKKEDECGHDVVKEGYDTVKLVYYWYCAKCGERYDEYKDIPEDSYIETKTEEEIEGNFIYSGITQQADNALIYYNYEVKDANVECRENGGDIHQWMHREDESSPYKLECYLCHDKLDVTEYVGKITDYDPETPN